MHLFRWALLRLNSLKPEVVVVKHALSALYYVGLRLTINVNLITNKYSINNSNNNNFIDKEGRKAH